MMEEGWLLASMVNNHLINVCSYYLAVQTQPAELLPVHTVLPSADTYPITKHDSHFLTLHQTGDDAVNLKTMQKKHQRQEIISTSVNY